VSSTEKKYQLFISSTYEDLKGARDEVIKAILSMYHIPIGMEMFSADDTEQWDTIKETIDNSDYYVLIIGHRYGSETKQGISYTEKEFDYARKKKIPVYTFVRNRNVPTSPQERDTDPSKAVKLEAFIKKAQATMVDFWDTPGDLGQKVSIAMMKAFTRRPRTGWVKSDQAASSETLKELTTLSRENRELKEELNKLKAYKAATPSLQVTFNGEENIVLNFSQDYDSSTLISFITPEILNSQDDGIIDRLNSRLIDPYNKWIESNPKVVKEYNQSIIHYEKAKASVAKFMVGLKNTGTLKANDINVIITFPVEFMVFDSKTKKQIPNRLPFENLPDNPLEEAIKLYNKENKISKKARDYTKSILASELNIKSNHHFIEIKERTVNFHCKYLLHTQSLRDDNDLNIYLLPIAIGNFLAKVEIICEEYSEPQNYEIPIIVQ
jgi:hypothetical protein